MSTAPIATSPRQEWLAQRRTGLGGSDIAAVLGIDGSQVAVWASKVFEPEDDGRAPANKRMKWGKRLERAVAEGYAEETAQHVEWFGERVLRHPQHSWWIGSPDAAVHGPAESPTGRPTKGLEIKTSGADQAWRYGDSGSDLLPEKFVVQVSHYMPLLDVEAFDVYALLGGNDDRVYTIERDRRLESLIAERGEEFWTRYVIPGVPPPMDDSAASAWYLRRRFPTAVAEIRDATPEEAELMRECGEARRVAAQADAEKDRLENAVKQLIGEARGIRVGAAVVTWGPMEGHVKWKDVALSLGATDEIAHQFRGEPTRRLNWPRGKEL